VNADTRAMIEAGERRLRDRRAAPQPDPMLELVNIVTADRDKWKALAGRYVIEAAQRDEEIARLIREQRAMRVVLQQQALLLDRSEPARVIYSEPKGANPQ